MAKKEPKPISMKKDRSEPAMKVVKPVEPFNMDAPEHREPETKVVKKIVKDKALEARVTKLEGAKDKETTVTVELPPRPRIANVRIKYDNFGNPVDLIPTYEG